MIVKPEEWISKPGDNGIGLLKVLMVEGEADFPILIETYNVFPEDVKIDEEQDFELILECADIHSGICLSRWYLHRFQLHDSGTDKLLHFHM